MNPAQSKNWVDTHFHVFHADVAVQGARYVPQYSATLSDWMALAQQVGVGRGVWVQPSFLGVDNSLMLRALDEHPDVLRGVAVLEADTPPHQLRGLHQKGVRGIRLNLAGVSHHIPEWSQADSMWECLDELGWHLELHTDQGALPSVLAQLPPDIPLVIDHMAKPEEVSAQDASIQALCHRAREAPTYVKLSGAYRLAGLDAVSLARLWLHELGPKALLWGSDWPCTNHEQLANYDRLFSDLTMWVGPDHLEDILCSTPKQVYWSASA